MDKAQDGTAVLCFILKCFTNKEVAPNILLSELRGAYVQDVKGGYLASIACLWEKCKSKNRKANFKNPLTSRRFSGIIHCTTEKYSSWPKRRPC